MPQTRARMGNLHRQTGPVTDAGKEISSRNALTHGGTSEKLIVPGERQEDFDTLLNSLLEEYSPETPDARNLVEDAALARWFLWRRQRAFNSVESALYAQQADPAAWPPKSLPQTRSPRPLQNRRRALLDTRPAEPQRTPARQKTASTIQTRHRPRHRRSRAA